MNKSLLSAVAVAGLLGAAPLLSSADDNSRTANRALVQQFGGQLKGALQKAIKSEGPVKAIEVCNLKAPEIAAALSKLPQLEVGRVSLKNRNPGNVPDAWERKVLLDFEAQKSTGTPITQLEYQEQLELNGKPVQRYIKAIPTGQVCLVCHGDNIAPPVKSKLNELYPEDKAFGFRKGDIRGAFSITRQL